MKKFIYLCCIVMSISHVHAMRKDPKTIDLELGNFKYIGPSSDNTKILAIPKTSSREKHSTLYLYTTKFNLIKATPLTGYFVGCSGDVVISSKNGVIHTLDYKTETKKSISANFKQSKLLNITVDRNNTFIATISTFIQNSTKVCTILLHNLDNKKQLPINVKTKPEESVMNVIFHPRQNMLVIATDKGRLGLYEFDKNCSCKYLSMLTCPEEGDLGHPVFSKKGTFFAACSTKKVYIYRLGGTTLKLNKTCQYKSSEDPDSYVQFSPDEKYLISTSTKSTAVIGSYTDVKIWLWETSNKHNEPTMICQLPKTGLSHDVKRAFFINGQKQIIIHDIEDWIKHVLYRKDVHEKYHTKKVPSERFNLSQEHGPNLYDQIRNLKD